MPINEINKLQRDMQPPRQLLRDRHFFMITGFLLIGFIFRLYPFLYENTIISDGVRYISQARAIFAGNFDLALGCGFEFLSLYHFLIPVFYKISGDWIMAAKLVSLLFGTLVIVPFYFIARQLFRRPIALVLTLAFALNPFLISRSADVIRGPVFWFFSLAAISFFIAATNHRGKEHYLFLSSIAFLLAGWARVEAIVFFIGSLLFILFVSDRKIKRLLIFCSPLLLLVIASLGGMLFSRQGSALWSFYLEPRLVKFLGSPGNGIITGIMASGAVRDVFLISVKLIEVLFTPAIFLVPGILVIKKEIRRNRSFVYFMILTVLSTISLFVFSLRTQTINDRYAAFVLLPVFVFIGSGIQEVVARLQHRGLQEKTLLVMICFFIIASLFVLPRSLVHKREDKKIYEIAGRYIAGLEKDRSVRIAAPDPRVMFYANYYADGFECTENAREKYLGMTRKPYWKMVAELRSEKMKYYLWESSWWNQAGYDFPAMLNPRDFRQIMQWQTKYSSLKLFLINRPVRTAAAGRNQ